MRIHGALTPSRVLLRLRPRSQMPADTQLRAHPSRICALHAAPTEPLRVLLGRGAVPHCPGHAPTKSRGHRKSRGILAGRSEGATGARPEGNDKHLRSPGAPVAGAEEDEGQDGSAAPSRRG